MGQTVLEGAEPYAVLNAADEKARRGADIPLRADLAADLSRHLADRLNVAQRAALRENRPTPARLPADEKPIAVPEGLVKILDRDLIAAGLARRVRDKGGWRTNKADERGRTFDVHAFRTTFNSLLAGAGVPLTTRRILMRHAAEGVTDEHYADAKLIDLRGALAQLPALPLTTDAQAEQQAEDGTYDDVSGKKHPRPFPRHLQREIERNRAAYRREADTDANTGERFDDSRNTFEHAELCEETRNTAEVCGTAGDGIRTHDVQLGKLAFYH